MAALSVFLGRPLLIRKVKGIHSVSAYVQSIMGRDLLMNQGARFDFNGGTVAAGVISSFLINDPRQPDAEFLQALPTTPYILFVGGLQPRKGLGTLLEAYQQLKSPPPLVLIGYASKDTPVSYPPGVYEFRNVSHPNVMAAWERSCFGVMPSVWPDPSPGVVREAMSKGKAVIGTNVGGTPEMLIDGKTGLLAPPDDAGALAQAMQRLIDQPMLREQLGRAAKEHATVFLSEVSVPRFEKLYRRLVKRTADSSETCHSPLVQTQ
jgi:glycosyltransferase involved in cell wall biosynthesis